MRVLDKYHSLKPTYQLLGTSEVPQLKQIYKNQQSRVPTFPVQPPPILDAKGQMAKNQDVVVIKPTEFEIFQKFAETQPLGDWSQAMVRVRMATNRPLIQYLRTDKIKTEAVSPKRASKSAKKETVTEGQNLIDFQKKEHFERMYIYLSKSPEQTKVILNQIARINILFIQKFGTSKLKEQFPADSVSMIDEYASMLSTINLVQVLTEETTQKKGSARKDQKSAGGSLPDESVAHNLIHPAITGYRFVDEQLQLFFLEAPAGFNLFEPIR